MGCPIEITCEDTGCPGTETCNVQSGACEKADRDCRTSAICRAGEVCDDETGACRPERLRCTQSFTCPQGQSCNASSGFCEPAFRCQSNTDCGIAEQCNTTSQECEARACQDDLECPVAFVCDGEDQCAAGCRPMGGRGCPTRQFCAVLAGDSIGSCVPNCREDVDCPFGQFCDLAAMPDSSCVAERPCSVDADCRFDEICSDTACIQPPCGSDTDCQEAQVCEEATRTCRPAACTEDNFGAGPTPNHAQQAAFTLDFGTYTQLVLCGGRSDWFALPVRSTDLVRIRLAQHADVDFDIYVYDEAGSVLVSNQRVGVTSSVKFAAGRDQLVYIEIRGTRFGSGTYDLTLVREVCANDAFEENDSLETATVVPSTIGVPSELALRACGFDEDWFRIRHNDPNAGLRVERVTSTADLRVEVLTPGGQRILVGNNQPLRMLRAGVTGSTYVRALGALGQTGDYRLAFEILSPWQCPAAGAHVTPTTAVLASQQAVLNEIFCPMAGSWEVDWVELAVNRPGVLDLVLRPTGDAPALEVVLWTGDGVDNTLVRSAVLVDGAWALQAAVAEDSRWFVRVSSSANVGQVIGEPGYELEYMIR